jgi:hypothetical protein
MSMMLYNFYSVYSGRNISHRTVYDILDFSDKDLEDVHDYIQWIFPLKEASEFNLDAPILTDQDIFDLKQDTIFLNKFDRVFTMMLKFYFYGDFPIGWWCQPTNHNLLRITRIIKCLKLFGEDKKAKFFYDCCICAYTKYCGPLPITTYNFWLDALK